MAFDLNMYPTGYGGNTGQAPQVGMPAQPQAPGAMGGVNNMVNALMGGYGKYLNRQQQQPMQPPAADPAAAGPPMQIHPDVGGQTASLGGATDANGNPAMMNALFNPNMPSGLY